MVIENKTSFAVMVIALTLTLMTLFQLKQIVAERTAITRNFDAQEEALAQVKKVDAQFGSLAVGTARLAEAGNTTAKGLVDQMSKLGININPNAAEGQKQVEFRQPQAPQRGTTTPTSDATPAAPAAVGN